MSGAIDTMTAEDTALLDSMRDDGPAPVDTAPPATPEPDIDLDDAPEVADAGEPDATGKQRMVPHAQLHAINERRKAAEAARQAAESALATEKAVTQERLRLLLAAAQAAPVVAPAPTPEPELPDLATDPVGHLTARLEREAKARADLEAVVQGFTKQQEEARAGAELRAWGQAQEREFTAKEPAYGEAMTHLVQARTAQLVAMGVTDPLAQRSVLENDINQIAQKSRAEGANFAERMFKVAETFGFKKADPVPAIPALDAALNAPLPDKAARVEQGRANATSIANAGGATPPALSPERIANLSDREFAAYLKKIEGNPAALRQLMGE